MFKPKTSPGKSPAVASHDQIAQAISPARPVKPKIRWFRAFVHILWSFVAIILVVTATLFWWAGTDGSLAFVIRQVQGCCLPPSQSLLVDKTSGSLLAGGRIEKLVWQQDGLSVTATDVQLAWQPWSLLQRRLSLQNVSAATVLINDQSPPAATPSTGPPQALMLPLAIGLDKFSIGQLRWSGASAASAVEVQDLAGRYGFDGQQHQLQLFNAGLAGGRYKGDVSLTGAGPLTLQASLAGAVTVTVPGSSSTLPLTFQAQASGPLTLLQVKASLLTSGVMTPAAPAPPVKTGKTGKRADLAKASKPQTTNQANSSPPHASLTATVTPWASQPLAQADASFNQLNLGALWPTAPQTLLTGQASVIPVTATGSTAGTANTTATTGLGIWQLQLNLVNRLSGPVNRQRLPLDQLDATGEWRNGTAMVRSLKALSGGGELTASGQWSEATASTTPTVIASATSTTATTTTSQPALQAWKLQANLKNINPALLHTDLAALPLSGQANVSNQGLVIVFDADIKVAGATGRLNPGSNSNKKNSIDQLRLQSASAKGSWNPGLAGGTLVLSALQLRTDDAELAGKLEAQPQNRAGKANLSLTAPGLQASINGELRPTAGDGELNLQARDVAQILRWLQGLPGVPDGLNTTLDNISARGNASLSTQWQGGWQDPTLQTRLTVPALDWGMSTPAASTSTTAATATTATTTTASISALKLRELQTTLSGRIGQAKITAQGRVETGERRFRLQLAANTSRTGPAGKTPAINALAAPAEQGWQAVIEQLSASVEDPALSAGSWGIATRRPTTLNWSPTANSGSSRGNASFEASAGEAVLNAPVAAGMAASSASISWQPVRWRQGELTTAGKITGLPMAWAELLAGPQLAGVGLSGNLVFEGEWDARLADSMNIKASLARSSGDISVQAETAEGNTLPIAAGVRQARLAVTSEGEALSLALKWDSERAGSADGQLRTRLSKLPASPDQPGGWIWASDAPLSGQLRAQLPRLGVWSVLAPPGWRVRGSLGANIAISGNRASPQLAGELQANDLALRSVVDGIEFGNGKLRASLDGTRMRINEFSLQGAGQVGSPGGNKNAGTGGILTAQGEAAWENNQPRVQIDAKIDRLRASIRTDRQVTVSGNLQARLDGQNTQLTGALKVDQARILLPEEGTPQLGEDVVVRSSTGAVASGQKGPAEANAPQATAPTKDARKLKVMVELDLGRDFRVQGKGMDTQMRGNLVLAADSLAEPRLTGSVNTFGGQYRAYGQRLDIEQGLLRFTGPLDNPTLDVLAIRPNLTQRVGVQITGTALLPRVRLYAQPELPDAEKLSWLVLGRSSASGGGEAALLQQAALALLGSKSGVGSGGGLAASLGLDELSYRGASNNADGSTTEGAVTLGKRFSRNLYAAYERSISGALGTLYIFYDLSRRFTLRAQAGQQSAVDLIFTIPYD